ncbi:carbon-nitrogen hydrolase family protein [bacterium]|nr:carbon-nitrogen hydrolase family protein [bacterium]
MRVALGQIYVEYNQVESNLARVQAAIAWAATQGADLVLLPETCLIGWTSDQAFALARPIPGPYTHRIARAARDHAVYVCIGLTEKVAQGIYDSLALFGPDGRLLFKYRKIHNEGGFMNPNYLSGDLSQVEVFQFPLGKAVMVICADSFNADVLDIIKGLDADYVLVPYAWVTPTGTPAFPPVTVDASGRMTPVPLPQPPGQQKIYTLPEVVSTISAFMETPVVGVNLVGSVPSGVLANFEYRGASCVADATGALTACCSTDPELRLATV